jgi:hypothetical protein
MLRALSTVLLLLLIGLWSSARAESLPRKNLWVELRWVDIQVSTAAVAAVRDGAVVLGTTGSYSPRGQVVLGTGNQDGTIQALPRLMVLNGRSASVQISETSPVQWLDYAVELAPGARGASAAAGARVYAAPRSGHATQLRGFSVSPRWPGGQAPVQVELRSSSDQGTGQAELFSTVQIPLGQWLTIARSGDAVAASPRGSLSTRDAEARTLRELQLRVDLAP